MSLGEMGKSVISTLGTQPLFLLVILINLVFLGFMMWFLEGQLHQRDEMAKQLFERCLETTLRGQP